MRLHYILNLLVIITVIFGLLEPANAAVKRYAFPLSVNGTKIIDSTGASVQMRCANWPSHINMIPEGLQWMPVADIVNTIVNTDVFNCIRFTYAVQTFFGGLNMTVRQRLVEMNTTQLIKQIETHNPQLIDAPLLVALDAVVLACNKANIMVLFDNQVSEAMWCCSYTDGNGWWNDKYFNVEQWLYSLYTISRRYDSTEYANVVAFSLRNELRTNTHSYDEQLRDWYHYVPLGIEALHAGKPTSLKFISGLDYDCNLVFLNDNYSNKTHWTRVFNTLTKHLVFEAHIYSWSGFGNSSEDCSQILPEYNTQLSWPINNNRPLVLTELGLTQKDYPNNQVEYYYWHCVEEYIIQHTLSFGIWVYVGSYLYLNNKINSPDSFGTLTPDFTTYAGPAFLKELQNIIFDNVTTHPHQEQLPHTNTVVSI